MRNLQTRKKTEIKRKFRRKTKKYEWTKKNVRRVKMICKVIMWKQMSQEVKILMTTIKKTVQRMTLMRKATYETMKKKKRTKWRISLQ